MTRSTIALAAAALCLGLPACNSAGTSASDGGVSADAQGSLRDASSVDAAFANDADEDAAAAACATPRDCPMHLGSQVYCCVDRACTVDVPDACPDGSELPIVASNYDQSCTTDSDCVLVAEGNACSMVGPCPSATISKAAYSKYQADIADVPCFGVSGCTLELSPCCRHGTCQTTACQSPADTLPACADAGGTCSPYFGTCAPRGDGPPDSCAYPDEKCCL